MARRLMAFLFALSSIGGIVGALAAEAVSVAALPPVVVETVPRAGDTAVDPATMEIRVTFSKPMQTRQMWSWVIHTKESFPEVAGDVRYLADGRTNVLPVRLRPGRAYAIWFNSPSGKHNAFRDTSGNPAKPYLLVFETRK